MPARESTVRALLTCWWGNCPPNAPASTADSSAIIIVAKARNVVRTPRRSAVFQRQRSRHQLTSSATQAQAYATGIQVAIVPIPAEAVSPSLAFAYAHMRRLALRLLGGQQRG